MPITTPPPTAEDILRIATEEVMSVRRKNLHQWNLVEPEDIAQEVHLAILENDIDLAAVLPNPHGYVRIMARHRALNAARQNRRAVVADFEGSSPDSSDDSQPTFGWVRDDERFSVPGPEVGFMHQETMYEWADLAIEAIGSLHSIKQAEVCYAYYGHGLNSYEIGAMLGIKPGTVRKRLYEARKGLSDEQRALLRGWRAYHHPEAKRPQKTALSL